jgi:multiple sugar transport system ATP-binding protein
MAGVKLENVTIKYGSLVALDNVSFECKEGEFFTLLGPSGAGKTTILELIAGIKQPAKGTIYIGNRVVNHDPPEERDVAMAFENYALYPQFSVYENVAFPLRAPRRKAELTADQERERVEEITSLLGIKDYLHRKPQQLSGGQKQRVSLARAMVRRPRLYLLDEPIAHLDAKLKISARSTLKKLAYQLKITILYVTHNYQEALGLSDRILVLRSGKVEQIGAPRELYETPATDFVARLIGDPPINLMDMQVVRDGGQVFLQADDTARFPLKPDLIPRMEQVAWQDDGKEMVRLGVRPNHVVVSKEKTSPESFKLPVYVSVREAKSTMVTFEFTSCFFQGMAENGMRSKVGEMVWVTLNQDSLLFFNPSVECVK